MSDTLPAQTPAGPPATSRPSIPTPSGRIQLTRKQKAAADAMVWEGMAWQDAARKANLTVRRMRTALGLPHVQRYIRDQKQVFRASASGANIHRAVEIREQDENRTAAIQAIRYLDGLGDEQAAREGQRQLTPGVVVTVNVHGAGDRAPDETVIEVNPASAASEAARDEPGDGGDKP